jgi:hypothetical protein
MFASFVQAQFVAALVVGYDSTDLLRNLGRAQ